MPRAVSLFLAIWTVWSPSLLTEGHGDDICMSCSESCGPSACSGNAVSTCCRYFDIYQGLVGLFLSANCSQHSQVQIIPPQVALNTSQVSGVCLGHHLSGIGSCLTRLPTDICLYSTIRSMDLSFNKLQDFPDLQCLSLLGRLDLSYNQLTEVPRDAFKGVPGIRDIFLDGNQITTIHPEAFKNLTQLNTFSIKSNRLANVDISLIMVPYPFCSFDYSNNSIEAITNKLNWTFQLIKNCGPGMVDFSYNQFKHGPKTLVKVLAMESVIDFAKLIYWGFDFRYNPLLCDCNMYRAAKWVRVLKTFIDRDYFDLQCASPPEWAGQLLYQIALDKFICNVTHHCPPGCLCIDRPSIGGMEISCSNLNLTSLPKVMPSASKLFLNFTNNFVRRLSNHKYLERAVHLNLRNNQLHEIAESVPGLLQQAELVDLRNNNLKGLPDTLRVLKPEAVLLDSHTLSCSCDLQWFKPWLESSKNSSNQSRVSCQRKDKVWVPLVNASQYSDLGCSDKPRVIKDHYAVLGVACGIFIVSSVVLLVFRYEIVVLLHLFQKRRSCKGKDSAAEKACDVRYHVFVSVEGSSPEDVNWVKEVLLPELERQSVSCYLPPRDCLPGEVEMDEITKRLQASAAALVVLSPDYAASASCGFQFGQAYSHMSARGHGRLLVVMTRKVDRREVKDPHLRAMLRLRMFHPGDRERVTSLVLNQLFPVNVTLHGEENRI